MSYPEVLSFDDRPYADNIKNKRKLLGCWI